MTEDHTPSRRSVLKATGGAFAATAPAIGAAVGTSGLATAAPGDVLEVNVGFSPGGDLGAAKSAADSIVRELANLDVVTIRAPKRAATALEQRADVDFVEENGRMHAFAQTLPWGIERVNANDAHACGYVGDGADLAIIDTGIDDNHPEDEHRFGSGVAFVNCGTNGTFGNCAFSGNSNVCTFTWSDDNGHGTHCAGIAAAIGPGDTDGVIGVAPGATLHSVKVLDCAGSGTFSNIAAGINHVATRGWDVGSLSFGASSSSSTVERAITNATNAGVTLVAAAGNSGPCTSCVAYPARHPDVIAVSASNSNNDLAGFSSQGPNVDIMAPGVDVLSTVPASYYRFSGTSMACSHVAGAAAILAAQGHSRSTIVSRLLSTARGVGLPPEEQGAGLLDAKAAAK